MVRASTEDQRGKYGREVRGKGKSVSSTACTPVVLYEMQATGYGADKSSL